ncbi:WD40-repeat-containing domain protein [Lipomyces arxii]|uniref:WD40-repeat-containing domain protein n=1 Tax=Lipomyces arxii TaxID=56418 RepID=UPI0034CD8628
MSSSERSDDVETSLTATPNQSRPSVSLGTFSICPSAKTVVSTTTTTTTTSLSPFVIQPPRRNTLIKTSSSSNDASSSIELRNELLDPIKYPLADQPTPSALKSFFFELDGQISHFTESQHTMDSIKDQKLNRSLPMTTSKVCLPNASKRTVTTTTTTTSSSSCNSDSLSDDATSRKRPASPSAASQAATVESTVSVDWNKAINRVHKRQMMVKAKSEQSSDVNCISAQNDNFEVQDSTQNTEKFHSTDCQLDAKKLLKLGLSTPLPSASPLPHMMLDDPAVASSLGDSHTSPKDLPNQPSLPSPSLSPVTGSIQKLIAEDYFSVERDPVDTDSSVEFSSRHTTMMMQIPAVLDTFESLPANVQDYVLYQLLRRCSKKTLSMVASTVMPALRCDFLAHLPQELISNILQYLDVHSLCVAVQVSKTWKQAVDGSLYTWRKLLDIDGFAPKPGEMEQAIREGWGMVNWNTTDGSSGSMARDLNIGSIAENAGPSTLMHSEIQAAGSAVALQLPFPNMYKAIYRRRYLINQNWMSPNSRPKHLSFPGHGRDVVTCLQFDADKIVTGSDDLSINVFDTNTGKFRAKLNGHEGGVWALQYHGNTIVSGSTDRTVRVWNIKKQACTQIFYGHTSTVRCLQIMHPVQVGTNPDGSPIMAPKEPIIITGSRDSTIRIWKFPNVDTDPDYLPETQSEDGGPYFLRVLQGHLHSVRAIDGHGDLLVSGSYDTCVRVWKISTGECLFRLAGHGAKVYSVVMDAQRSRCVSGSMDWLIKVWSLETGSCLYTLEGHTSLVGLLELNYSSLVSAAADATLRVWDPETGQFRHKLEGHAGAITCFQHDNYKVVSGSEGALKLWDIRTGRHVKDLLSDVNRVWQVRFDERRCVAAVQRGNRTSIEVLNFDYDPASAADDALQGSPASATTEYSEPPLEVTE